jgi:hypothetical protein
VASPQGESVLVVKFPWRDFSQPSLQLALCDDPKADPANLQPMVIDPAVAVPLWQRMAGAINQPLHAGTSEVLKTAVEFIDHDGGRTLRVCSATNALGQPSCYGLDEKDRRSAVFYQLDAWSGPDGAVRIAQADLGRVPAFAQSSPLRVWFLDAQKVIWATTVDWPGKDAPKPVVEPPPPPPAKPAQPPVAKTPITLPPVTSVLAPETVPMPAPAVQPKPVAPRIGRQQPPAIVDLDELSVDELAQYIEKTWGKTMSPKVRKNWVGGWHNYYEVDNAEAVRRDVFLQLVKLCRADQPPGDLRDALGIFYRKLKQQRPQPH